MPIGMLEVGLVCKANTNLANWIFQIEERVVVPAQHMPDLYTIN